MTLTTVLILVLSLVMAWLLSKLYPAAFSTEGIYTHSFWGTRRMVRWADIQEVRRFRLLNLLWLRVFDTNGKIGWLPLFQSDKAAFRQELQRLAPPGSPILNRFSADEKTRGRAQSGGSNEHAS